jgi:hypothetical protein
LFVNGCNIINILFVITYACLRKSRLIYMKNAHHLMKRYNIYGIALAVVFSVAFVALGVGAATTISTNISTDGTLTVTGASTLSGALTVSGASTHNGDVTLGDAVTDSVTATAYFTQLRIGTGSTFGNIGTVGADELGVEGAVEIDGIAYLDGGAIAAASSTASAAFNVHGVLTASSTLLVGSAATFGSTVTVNSAASTTPAQELTVSGDAMLTSAATSTVVFDSTDAESGGCVQLQGTDGSVYRIYIAATSSASVDFRNLVVEAGACQ